MFRILYKHGKAIENRVLRERGIFMGYIDRIEIDPRVCNGKPVIKGTRIPVTVILAHIADDESWQDFVTDYPELSLDDIKAAAQYAGSFLENSELTTVHA